jgi:hypothetical protein
MVPSSDVPTSSAENFSTKAGSEVVTCHLWGNGFSPAALAALMPFTRFSKNFCTAQHRGQHASAAGAGSASQQRRQRSAAHKAERDGLTGGPQRGSAGA